MPDETKRQSPPGSALTSTAIEASTAVAGALVGLAIGGPIGAAIGAATPPAISSAIRLAQNAQLRRRQIGEEVVLRSFARSGLTLNDVVMRLEADAETLDVFVALLRRATESDESLRDLFASLMAELLQADGDLDRDRVAILADSLAGIRRVHLRVLNALYCAGGRLSAPAVAEEVNIPEVELRSVVRGLELRGMIKDTGQRPVVWRLRELGEGVVRFMEEESEK